MEVGQDKFKFSLVLSVYKNDSVEHFVQALESCLNQTLLPDQLIIVVDGPIGDDLRQTIEYFKLQYSFIEPLFLKENMGRGAAKNHAITHSKYGFIAIMDADDICLPNRFQMQKEFLMTNPEIDCVGSYIEEFNATPGDLGIIRKVNLIHDGILIQGKYRQSMNHVTIMFKKQVFLSVGGYSSLRYTEDFIYFTKLLISGATFANLPVVLVYARVAQNQFKKRAGMKYFKEELSVFKLMYNSKYISLLTFFINVLIRLILRFSPSIVLMLVYNNLLRKRVQ